MNQLLTVVEVARLLTMSVARVYELVRENILPAVRFGRQVRINPDALDAFIKGGGKSLPGGWRKDGDPYSLRPDHLCTHCRQAVTCE